MLNQCLPNLVSVVVKRLVTMGPIFMLAYCSSTSPVITILMIPMKILWSVPRSFSTSMLILLMRASSGGLGSTWKATTGILWMSPVSSSFHGATKLLGDVV